MGIRTTKPAFLPRGILVLVVVLVFALAFVAFRGVPGEKALVKRFQTNRAAFVELKEMLSTNSPGEPNRPDTTVWSVEHYRTYRALLRQAGVLRGIYTGTEFRFIVVEPKPRKQGERIAVTWTDAKPEPVLARLDDFRKTGSQPEQAYRALGENWYLWISK